MAARTRVKADAIQIPRNQEEAELLLGQIGGVQRKLTENEVSMNSQLSAVKDRYKKRADELKGVIEGAFKRLHAWAEANKATLLPSNKKTAEMSTGRVSWRRTPPKVTVKNTEKALAELKEKGLHRFIRTVEELDKEAIIADRDAAKDLEFITVGQKTEFVAKPHDTNIETVGKARS